MEKDPPRLRTIEEYLSRALVEIVDNNAHLMTVLDLQARILAALEDRPPDHVVEEVNAMLRGRRREAISGIEHWATGRSTRFGEEEGPSEEEDHDGSQ